MWDLFRDTVCGRLLRAISGGKLCAYTRELEPSFLEKYMPVKSDSESTSLNLDGKPADNADSKPSDSELPATSETQRSNPIDQEKGADHLLVTWAPNDPDNPRNWSTPKKLFVTFQICFLTTSVYIGSAIYTAGLRGVTAQFHISEVHALVGLTLFVLGYALGPMVWVRIFAPLPSTSIFTQPNFL